MVSKIVHCLWKKELKRIHFCFMSVIKIPLSRIGGMHDLLLLFSNLLRQVQYFLTPVLGSETFDPRLLK